MDRQTSIRDYVIEHSEPLSNLIESYPNIFFEALTSTIANIQVPQTPEGETDFQRLLLGANAAFVPLVFGLNISEPLFVSGITQLQTYPLGELRGQGVLVGFVDTGIDYTNTLFKYEDNTTRIISIWDQTIEGAPPPSYSYGSVYSSEQINEALANSDPYSIVPSRDTIGHGTFLAGVATGNDRSGTSGYIGGAPDSELVVVKLRPAKEYLREYYLLEEDAIAFQANNLMTGINYLLSVAREQDRPMAICIGLGCNLGPHNGLTIVERFLSTVSELFDVIVVSSAGNEGNQGHHYSNSIAPNQTQTIELNVGEGENGLVVQLWVRGPDKVSMGFSTPLGNKVEKIPPELITPQEFSFGLEKSKITFTYQFPNLITGSQLVQIRIVNPTPGIWTFTVYGDFIIAGTYDLWIAREGFITPNTRFLRPDSYTTVCIPSTAEKLIVVGAYNSLDNSFYAASGRGPTTTSYIKPDLVAPGVNILGPDLRGDFVRRSGTSASAAITTSACALLLQWGVIEGNFNIINTNIARTILIRGAERNPNTSYPNPLEGYGRLNLFNSINLV